MASDLSDDKHIMADGEPRREIGMRLHILARVLRNQFDRHVSNLNVTRSQWQLIAVVGRSPGVTQRTIAEALEISEASAGRLIDRLCAEGMLERRERDDDRRARAVYLTRKSEPLLTKLAEVAKIREAQMFKGFSDKDLDTLTELLDRIYQNATHS